MIVDANVANELVNNTPDAIPVMRWLLNPKSRGGLIIGGRLTVELYRTKLRETLVVLAQSGRLKTVDDAKIDAAANRIDRSLCRSNDVHIIAAAVASGCRLIYTRDQKLQKDVKNRKLLDPVASIYTSRKHHRLLAPCECKV